MATATILDFHDLKNIFILKNLKLNSILLELILWADIKFYPYYNQVKFWEKDKLIHGPFYIYDYKKSQLYFKHNYKNGILHGIQTEYDNNGNVKIISDFVNGKEINRRYIIK